MSDDNFKSIPTHTKVLYLKPFFNQPLKKGNIPNSVTTLNLGYYPKFSKRNFVN
jgi:hypothetical protein